MVAMGTPPNKRDGFMRLTHLTFLALVPLAFSLPGQAQDPVNWSASVGCELPPNTERMEVTLPLGVLDHLERTSSSVFVHAFLLRYISDSQAGQHRLSQCARNFVGAGLTDFRTLRQNVPDAAAIIGALREAELARLRTLELADSARTLVTVVARLRADSSQANLQASGEQLAAARKFCTDSRIGACGALHAAVDQLESLRLARSGLDAAREKARQTAEEAARATEAAETAASQLAADTLLLMQFESASTPTDTAAIIEVRARIAEWRRVVASRTTLRDSLRDSADAVAKTPQDAAEAAAAAQTQFNDTLARLSSLLERAQDLGSRSVEAFEGSRIGTFLIDVAAPPTQTGSVNPAAPSANLLLELTDFIIERMRREAVNSFIVNLHGLAQHQPLLQYGFPETWGLMQGLPTLPDGRLSAVDVGRLPLNTWRATLAGDFVQLPVNLLEAGPAALCGSEVTPGAAVQPLLDSEACRRRLIVLEPLVPVATRLLEGDALFDILGDAGSLGSSLPPDFRHLSQGLNVLAALAQSYVVQGYAPKADPMRHPYILTSQSLAQVPQRQRDAFVRLLLVRVVPSVQEIPAVRDPAALENTVAGAIRVFERIASRPPAAEPRPADAGFVLRGAFDALIEAADLATVLAPSDAAVWLNPMKTDWRVVSGTLEAIVTRNFGLALARTTVLLRDLRGVDVPAPVLTFTALASSLSEAQDGGQVRAAFEAAASPVGGWQGKRYGSATGSITAFPGAAFGFEQAIGEAGDSSNVEGWATAVGASLPIGLEVQFKLSKAAGTSAFDCRVICGFGIFVPLVDLGALLSYRVNGPESVETEPNANLRQVFAPGLYASVALTRTVPLNLLVGGQLMPSLRSVSGPQGTETRSAFRLGVGIGMDIMLFKF